MRDACCSFPQRRSVRPGSTLSQNRRYGNAHGRYRTACSRAANGFSALRLNRSRSTRRLCRNVQAYVVRVAEEVVMLQPFVAAETLAWASGEHGLPDARTVNSMVRLLRPATVPRSIADFMLSTDSILVSLPLLTVPHLFPRHRDRIDRTRSLLPGTVRR